MQETTLFEKAKKELGFDTKHNLLSTDIITPSSDNLTDISEWLALEKARKIGAHFVYFRRFENRPSQPLIYIFDYSERENLPDNLTLGILHKDIWSSSEVPCTFIFSKSSLKILNTSKEPTPTINNGFLPVELLDLAFEINQEIRERFSFYRLDSGEFWNKEEENFAYNKSAHKTLLDKLKNVRENIIKSEILPIPLVNRLLIQCVLIRFLEEKKDVDTEGNVRKVFPEDFFQKIAGVNSFQEAIEKGTFIQVFDYLNTPDQLNGKIFEWSKEEKQRLREAPSNQLISLLYETDVDNNYQRSFWDLYSFRFLPVEVISSIYEALFTTNQSVKEEGMVYTPPHLAAFLVDEAMPLNDWKDKADYKILDPACGSGVFLVVAFKRLVHWWRLSHDGQAPTAKDLTAILDKNIYGIDSNENAVLLTRFSLCLALCDMLTPPEIWFNLHFPTLENKLVHADFFDWHQINRDKVAFDLVIGNPPFVQAHKKLPDWKTISTFKIPQKQIALYFLSAARNLVKEKGLMCLILKSSSLLYTTTGNDFRDNFFAHNKVHQIIDFTLLARNHVLWTDQEPDTLALFATKETPATTQNILHLVVKRTPANSIKRYFEIDSYDFHWVSYSTALQDDFVWKCNLLGGGRLYNLIKYLESYPKLIDLVNENKDWALSGGYRPQSKPNKSSATDERGRANIADKKYLPSEWFSEDGIRSFNFPIESSKYFKHTGDVSAYKAPHIFIKANIGDKHSIPLWYFSDLDLGFREKVIGLSAPSSDKHKLEEIFNFLKKYNNLLRTYLVSTSPECLINMNTLVQVQDIKNLPIILSSKQINNFLDYYQEIIINDINKYFLEAIRRPETTNVLHPIPSRNLENRIQSFASIFCDTLNKIYETEDNKFYLAEAGKFNSNDFIYTAFRYDNKLKKSGTHKTLNILEYTDEKLRKLLSLDKGHTHFKRILKIYQKDYVCFIKPNQLRYWLDSIALRDTDEVIADMVRKREMNLVAND